jgi:excisionase family DNA binding protein
MLTSSPKYISIPQYAEALGISRITVYQRVIKGLIPAKKIGRNYVIFLEKVVETMGAEGPRERDLSPVVHPHYSVAQYAKKCGISRVAVFQKIKNGQIRAVKCGRNYIIPADTARVEVRKPSGEKRKKLLKKVRQFISIPELAKELGLSRIDVYQKVKAGKIKAEKIGRNFVVSQQSVYSTLSAQEFKEGFLSKDYISIPQMARELGVSRITIYKRVKQGLIAARKVGRNFVIKRGQTPFKPREQEAVE